MSKNRLTSLLSILLTFVLLLSMTSLSAFADTSDTSSGAPAGTTASNIPWKLIITLAVIVIIIVVLLILTKTNSKLGQRIKKFFKDYKSELKKVSWMSRKDLVRSTLVVLVVLLVAGLAIGLLDIGFSWVLNLLTKIG